MPSVIASCTPSSDRPINVIAAISAMDTNRPTSHQRKCQGDFLDGNAQAPAPCGRQQAQSAGEIGRRLRGKIKPEEDRNDDRSDDVESTADGAEYAARYALAGAAAAWRERLQQRLAPRCLLHGRENFVKISGYPCDELVECSLT